MIGVRLSTRRALDFERVEEGGVCRIERAEVGHSAGILFSIASVGSRALLFSPIELGFQG